MSIINKDELKEKTKEVVTHTVTEVKTSSKTIKVLLAICLAAIIGLSYTCYGLYTRTAELEVLKQENVLIKNRMNDIENKIAKNHFEYLEIENRVNNIKSDLQKELAKAKEVVVHEVTSSSDIINVLNDLSDHSTDK